MGKASNQSTSDTELTPSSVPESDESPSPPTTRQCDEPSQPLNGGEEKGSSQEDPEDLITAMSEPGPTAIAESAPGTGEESQDQGPMTRSCSATPMRWKGRRITRFFTGLWNSSVLCRATAGNRHPLREASHPTAPPLVTLPALRTAEVTRARVGRRRSEEVPAVVLPVMRTRTTTPDLLSGSAGTSRPKKDGAAEIRLACPIPKAQPFEISTTNS